MLIYPKIRSLAFLPGVNIDVQLKDKQRFHGWLIALIQ